MPRGWAGARWVWVAAVCCAPWAGPASAQEAASAPAPVPVPAPAVAEEDAAAAEAAAQAAAEAAGLLFPNSDFEQGDLRGWRVEGDAFLYQPTLGDNCAARDPERAALPQGRYFAGTYELFRGQPGQRPGGRQGDAPQGGLASLGFTIARPHIGFLLAGGGEPHEARVQLIVAGAVVREAEGSRSETMRRVVWDVAELVGKRATLYVMDRGTEAWGHINVDDFRYVDPPADPRLFENSDFEQGSYANWTAEGEAFGAGPVKGDAVAARSSAAARHAGEWWAGSGEAAGAAGGQGKTPEGVWVGDVPTGVLRSVPFTIQRRVIAYRVAGSAAAGDGVFLVVDGKDVREGRGHKTESMNLETWNVTDLVGKQAHLEIRDGSAVRWGHVNADDFVYARTD